MKQPWLEGEFAEVIEDLKRELKELNETFEEASLAQETLKQLSEIIENIDRLQDLY